MVQYTGKKTMSANSTERIRADVDEENLAVDNAREEISNADADDGGRNGEDEAPQNSFVGADCLVADSKLQKDNATSAIHYETEGPSNDTGKRSPGAVVLMDCSSVNEEDREERIACHEPVEDLGDDLEEGGELEDRVALSDTAAQDSTTTGCSSSPLPERLKGYSTKTGVKQERPRHPPLTERIRRYTKDAIAPYSSSSSTMAQRLKRYTQDDMTHSQHGGGMKEIEPQISSGSATPQPIPLSRNRVYDTSVQLPGAYPLRGSDWVPGVFDSNTMTVASDNGRTNSNDDSPANSAAAAEEELGEMGRGTSSYQYRRPPVGTGTTTSTVEPPQEPVAMALTIDDLEREVQIQLIANAPSARIVVEPDKVVEETHNNSSRCLKRTLVIVVIVFCVTLVAVIVPLTQRRGQATTMGSTEASLSPPETEPPQKDELVYVISMDIANWCGHNNHRANRCGGHLASINNPEEKSLVDELKDIALREAVTQNATSWGGPIEGVWIGGNQFKASRNDSGTEKRDIVWGWADGSTWFDGEDTDPTHSTYGNYWEAGEPNNNNEVDSKNRTKGEHNIFLTPSGKYRDENGCFGELAPKGPGIYILPIDYTDVEKYPDCQRGPFLEEYAMTIPQRLQPEWVYVLNQKYMYRCNRDFDQKLFRECGGYGASITNVREKAIVDMLKDIALKTAKADGKTNVDGVWIGGAQPHEGRNNTGQEEINVDWKWNDGSPWFDNAGAYWAEGQPDNAIHNITNKYDWHTRGEHALMLNGEGLYQDELDCTHAESANAKLLPSIYMLPFDYSNRTKYIDCQSGSFIAVIPVPPRS